MDILDIHKIGTNEIFERSKIQLTMTNGASTLNYNLPDLSHILMS